MPGCCKKQKKQHEKLPEAYIRQRQHFEIEGLSDDLVKGLHDFLENRLVNHILKTDMHMRACIKS